MRSPASIARAVSGNLFFCIEHIREDKGLALEQRCVSECPAAFGPCSVVVIGSGSVSRSRRRQAPSTRVALIACSTPWGIRIVWPLAMSCKRVRERALGGDGNDGATYSSVARSLMIARQRTMLSEA